MIHHIYSNLPSFKEIHFQPGLNIILAEKSPDASERQTRNSAGKTSVVELIHFLLGAKADKKNLFRKEALVNHTFGIKFDLYGTPTTIERSGKRPSSIFIVDGDPTSWPIRPDAVDEDTGKWKISNTNWRINLGALIFGLTWEPPSEDDKPQKYGPTFRSLFSYFTRRQESDGFLSPHTQSRYQRTYDHQVALTFLLGLDWTIPQQWEVVRQKEKMLAELRKAASGDDEVLGTIIGKSAELRTELFIVEQNVDQLGKSLDDFQVLPQYRELEREATALTSEITSMANSNTIDRQLVSQLEDSLNAEAIPSFAELQELYREVGIVLPERTVRRFDEVRSFHESVIQNRKSYLDGELNEARARISNRDQEIERLDKRRAEIMGVLNSHGALDQFNQLRSELSRQEAEAENLRQRLEVAEQLEGLATELEIERNQLLLRLRQDFREQADVLRQAIGAFEEVSDTLYEQAGSLTIAASSNGPVFEVKIQGEKSKGISNMQIYCFDMMLMKICMERNLGPGFLIHDSHLFDGVDERQVANALQIGAELSENLGFQYIVTMNSDALPMEYSSDFNINDYILDVRLTDAAEDGGLFGFRFD